MTFGCELSECYFVHGSWGLSIIYLPLLMASMYLIGALLLASLPTCKKQNCNHGENKC